MNKLFIATVLISILISLIFSYSYAAHSVTVCGNTYVCGASDGVCPEDFPGFGKCDVSDPDCKGEIKPITGGGSAIANYPLSVYNCTPGVKEVNEFDKIINSTVYSLDGYCVDMLVARANTNSTAGTMNITTIFVKPNTNLTEYKGFNVNSTFNMSNVILYFRVPKTWSQGIIKRTISLVDKNGTKYPVVYVESDNSYLYYKAWVNHKGEYFVVGKEKFDIWYLISRIDDYYNGKLSFVKVVELVLDYYG